MDRFGLDYFYRRSREHGTLVVAMELKGELAAVSLLLVRDHAVVIELLLRNRTVASMGAGHEMMEFIVNDLSRQLDVEEVSLEALNRNSLIEYYERNGFIRYGMPYFDQNWGELVPMKKRVARVGQYGE